MTSALGRGLSAAAAVALLAAAFVLWSGAAYKADAVEAVAPDIVLGTKPLPAGPARALAQALRAEIGDRPLNQRLVNGYWTLATIDDFGTPADRERWRRELAGLGWQSTPAQLNLMIHGAQTGDLTAVLDRTDAMLRRKRIEDRFAQLLYLVEQSPANQAELVGRLHRQVPWRTYFFMNDAGVATAAGRAARQRTIDTLAAAGDGLSRAEIAPFLNAQRAADALPLAYRNWTRYRRMNRAAVPAAGASFDPDFTASAHQPSVPNARDIPFEWEPLSGNGYSSDVDDGSVFIEWDGIGVPVLLRQTFRARPGPYRIVMTGPDATPELLKRVAITIDCGADQTGFTPVTTTANGLVLSSQGAVGCVFPTLSVKGRPSLMSDPVQAALDTLAARPAR